MADTKFDPGVEVKIKHFPHIRGPIRRIQILPRAGGGFRVEYFIGDWPQPVPEKYLETIEEATPAHGPDES